MSKKVKVTNSVSSPDITEHKRVEEELRHLDEFSKIVLESTNDAVCLIDVRDFKIVGVNSALLKQLGLKKEGEVIGKTCYEVIHHQSKPCAAPDAPCPLSATVTSGKHSVAEHVHYGADGEKIYVEVSTSPVKDKNGKVTQVIHVSRDITERKRMEEELEFRRKELEDIMRNVIDGIGVSDMQGKITQANRALAEMHGYHSPDEVIGRPFFDFVAKEDLPRIAERFQEMMVKKEKTAKNIEMIGLKKDGSRFSEMINITNSWDRDGSLIGSFVVVHDITERKEAEEALRESEERYKTLFESKLEGVFVIDAETMQVVLANQAAAKMYGFDSAEDAVGVNPLDFIPPEDRERVIRLIAEDMFEKDLRQVNEFRTMTKDGREIWVGAMGVRTGYEGRLAGLISFRDITERKEAEEALQQSEHNLKTYLESAPDGVYLNDLKGKFLYGNKKAEEMTGYEREELIGSSFLKLNLLPAKYLAKAGKLLALNAIGRPTGPDEFELTRKDGSRIWVEINTTPIKQEGKVVVIGFVRDITERKRAEEALQESEERYLDLVNLLPQTIFEMDERGNLTFANRQGTLAFGYTLEDVQKGLNALEFFIPEDRDRVRKNVYRILSGEQESGANEYTALRKDGSTFPVISYSSAIIRENKPAGLIGVLMDITQRKRMERELQERNEQLDTQNEELQSQAEELMTQQQELMEKTREVEKATRLKSEFLANMSHELRTPLNVIIGFSQLMVDEVPGEINEEQRQSLNDILDSSQRLLNLINEVLDLSKIESGKMELKPKDVALTEVIKSLTRTMMPMLAPRKQSLDIEIEAGLPLVHADKAKLGQVLLNLVDNSSKFTPDGGKLKIEAVKEGDWCRVSVVDNGIGIKKEDQEKIFEPFCRLDDPLTKGRSGTGLGLPLVKQIVERYGGRIWVESEHGKGSRFTVTVPLATNGQPNPEERDRR